MKRVIKNLVFITIPALLILVLILEVVFRFVIPAAEIPAGHFDEATLVFKLCPNDSGVYTMGRFAQKRAIWRTNNHGWNSPIYYATEKTRKRIAIIGDSYVEALQVDVDKSFPSLLRARLKSEFDVYSFGKAGAPFSQYLNVSRYVRDYFEPDIFIFNIAHNDFDESITTLSPDNMQYLTLNISDAKISERRPQPNYSFQQYNWRKRVLVKSALVRYLYHNLAILELTMNMGKGRQDNQVFDENVEVDRLLSNKELISKATEYIVGKIRSENAGKRIIFVMDGPRWDIYRHILDKSSVLFLHQMMELLCRRYNVELVDLTAAMQRDYELNCLHFESRYDWHWNEYGHEFVCRQLMTILKKKSPAEEGEE